LFVLSDTPHTSAPNAAGPSDPEDWTRPFEMRQLQMLGDLAEVGLEVARAIERRTREAGPEEDLTRLALAYSRAARAVRLSAMLQSRLIKDIKADAQAAAKARTEAAKAEAERAAEHEPAYRCKSRVENIVYRVAGAGHPGDAPAVARVIREAGERLDDEDLYGDLLERPLSEIVARICRDLGLEPDWGELAQEWWAAQEVESGDVGWPLSRSPSPSRGEGRDEGEFRAPEWRGNRGGPPPSPHFARATLAPSSQPFSP
jgi:hypothetical protein